MFHQGQVKSARRSARVLPLAAFLLAAMCSALQPARVDAAPTFTTVSVYDGNGVVNLSKVAVFDASNGRQVAGGLTDPATGLFTFRSPASKELVVTAHTSTGYVGSARVSPGTFAAVTAAQEASEMQTAGVLDPSRATVTVTDEAGAPVAGAQVAIVSWQSFEKVTRGTTDEQGQLTFRVPADMPSDDFLAAAWDDAGGAIRLLAVVQPHPPTDGAGGGTAWPAF